MAGSTWSIASRASRRPWRGPFGALNGTAFGFDFNPTVDRIRIVSNAGQNLRVHPDTGGLVATDGALTPSGSVSAAAYTNNRAGATTTTLYDIDTATDQLLIQNPPNTGVLTPVGPLGVDASDVNGFDISAVDGTAFAALTVGGAPQLYTISLATGAARPVGAVAGGDSAAGAGGRNSDEYAFAEGATGTFFTTEFALANPTGLPAPVTAIFQRADGASLARTLTLAPFSRATLDAATVPGLAAAAFGAVFTSADGVPLAVERTMRWDATGYGMHGERAVSGPALVWHFAEGSQGFFDNYLLLSNPGASASTATVEFLVQGGPPVTRVVQLPPMSRANVYGGEIPELANRAFGATVTFSVPGVAERAMYFGNPLFNGGSVAAGVQAPSTDLVSRRRCDRAVLRHVPAPCQPGHRRRHRHRHLSPSGRWPGDADLPGRRQAAGHRQRRARGSAARRYRRRHDRERHPAGAVGAGDVLARFVGAVVRVARLLRGHHARTALGVR